MIGLIIFYRFNRHFKLIDLSVVHVTTSGQLSTAKVRIQRGIYSIERKNDQELFANGQHNRTVYNGFQTGLLKTDYGENDFLITYDDKYYFQFRHFIFNGRDQHSYNFYLYQQHDIIYVQANINGPDTMKFIKPMHLISDAKYLRCNVPIDSTE